MASYSIATSKDRLSALIARAQAGEDVVITNRGKPAVRLVPVDLSPRKNVAQATERLRRLVAAAGGEMDIPVERFHDWLYEDDAH